MNPRISEVLLDTITDHVLEIIRCTCIRWHAATSWILHVGRFVKRIRFLDDLDRYVVVPGQNYGSSQKK
jgi:hypothetical protein